MKVEGVNQRIQINWRQGLLALLLSLPAGLALANTAPVADPQNVSTPEDTDLPITLNGSDIDGDPLSYSIETSPANGSLSGTPPNVTYAPNGNFNGADSFTFIVNDGTVDSDPATISITVDPVNDPPSFTAGANQVVLEDSGASSVPAWASSISAGPADESGQAVSFSITANDNPALFIVSPSVSASGELSFTPASNANGVANISVSAMDDGGTANGGDDTSDAQAFSITVTAVNDVPTLQIGSNQAVDEDSGLQTVPGFASASAGGGADESGQTFTYNVSNDNNPLFSTQPSIDATGQLSYQAAAATFGSALVTVSVTDNGGTTNGGVDTSADKSFTITVNAVNIPPVANPDSVVTNEDISLPITLTGSDDDGDPLTFSIDTGPANGVLSGTLPNVNYTPNADYHGADSFTFVANDGLEDSAPATVSITINPVNDPPEFTGGPSQVDLEDAAPVNLAAWATLISPGPADEAGQVVSFAISANDNPGLFSTAPAVNNSGDLSYALAANANGVANISVTASDDGGTANGGDDTSTAHAFTITVNAVNDQPGLTIGSNQAVSEDPGSLVVPVFASASAGGGSDENTQTFSYNVSNDNNALFSVQPAIDPSGQLTYTPVAETSGSALVTVSVTDSGGTLNGGQDTSGEQSFTITVSEVNDPPTFTKGPNQAVLEDTPAVNATGWASNISAGPADESGQVVTFIITGNDNAALFSVAPAVNPAGDLSYTLAPDAHGTSNITVMAMDDGGTANGGDDDSDDQAFSITATSVNDAPSFVAGASQIVDEDDPPVSVTSWATSLSSGPANESGQILSFQVTGNDNPAIFAAGPSISTSGDLSYTPASNANGVANLDVVIMDNGGTTDGGVDTSASQAFSITINAINDPPVAGNQFVDVDEDVPTPITLTATDPENDPLTYTVVLQPVNGVLTGTAPNLTYTSNTNFVGFDSFTYKANDGEFDSQTRTINIEIFAVNDAPVADPKSTSTPEDEDVIIILSGSDVEGDSLTFLLNSQPTHGSLLKVGTQVTYTPDSFYFGADSFTYVADDGMDQSAPATVDITVTPVNDAPFATDDNLTLEKGATTTVLNGGSNNLLDNDSDIEGDNMSVTTTPATAPSHGSVTLFANGTFSYTHDNSLNLGDSFEYEVCDDQVPSLCSTATVSVFVDLGPDGVCTQPNAAIPDDDPVTGVTSSIDFAPSGALATVAVMTNMTHTWIGDLTVTLTHDGTTVRLMERPGLPVEPAGCDDVDVNAIFDDDGTQTAHDMCLGSDMVPGISGNVIPVDSLSAFQGVASLGTWSLKVTDSNMFDIGTLVNWCLIAIVNPAGNTQPSATPQSLGTDEDTPLGITLSGSDPEGDPLTFRVATPPSNGTLSGTAPNITYTPDLNFVGADSFTFTSKDGFLTSAPATINITVSNINDGPIALDDAIVVNKGATITLLEGGGSSLLDNDMDVEGNNLTVTTSPVSSPAHGSLTLNSNGTFSYTHDDTFSPTDGFSYEVCDDGSPVECATADVTIWTDLSVSEFCSAPDIAITDGEIVLGVSDSILLAGVGGIGDLDVLLDIKHTLVGDLNVVLHSHTGSSISLLDRPGTTNPELDSGCMTDDVEATFSDEASQQAENKCNSTPPAISGSVRPFNLLSNFDMTAVAGNWTLQVFDAQPFETGTFRQWCLFPTLAGNTAPVADPQSVNTDEETAVGITLTGSDVDGDPITFSVVSQPSDGQLSGTAPNLTYTPDTNFFGADSFTFRTNDGSLNSATATVTITVANTDDPPVADAQSVSTDEDIAKGITLTGSDIDGDSLSFAIDTPPTHGSLSGSPPNVTYTPTLNYNGSDSFSFVVNDGQQDSPAATVSITINPINDPPEANRPLIQTDEDTAVSTPLSGFDVDGDPITFAVVSQPTNGVLSGVVPDLTYTPAENFNGGDSFLFKTNDGLLDSTPEAVTITVHPVNDPPDVTGESMTAGKGTVTSTINGGGTSLLANDSDIEGGLLSLSGTPVTPPMFGTVVLNSDGTFSYTHDNSISISDSFVYEVCDDGIPSECSSATVIIYVDLSNSPECQAPMATIPDNDIVTGISDTLVITESDTIVDLDVFLLISHDFVGHLSATLAKAGTSVVLLDRPGVPAIDASGCPGLDVETRFNDEAANLAENECSGTPPAIGGPLIPAGSLSDFDGQDINGSWTLTITDAEAGAEGIFEQWCLLPNFSGNTPPTANAQSVSTAEDVPKPITLTATDSEGDTLTFDIDTLPSNGTLSGAAPNVLYIPALNFNGADSFTFTANDGTVDSAPATVSITITVVNDSPVAHSQSVSVTEDIAQPITLTGSDVEGDSITFSIVDHPVNGVLSGTAPSVTYTPDSNYSGADGFTFKTNDGNSDSLPATVSITVTADQDAPVADAQSVSTDEDTAKAITLTGSDLDGDPLTFEVLTPPANGNLTGTPPGVTYTPDTDFNGMDSFTFRVNDGIENSSAATVNITVTAINDPPLAVDDSMTALKGLGTSTLDGGSSSLLANDSDLDGDTLSVTVTPVLAPLFGTITLNANGTFLYTHDNSLNTTDNFMYEACDDGVPILCHTATVDIYVDLSVDPKCSAPILGIPDNDPVTGVSDTINIAEFGAIEDMNIFLLVSHSHVGDLKVTIQHGAEVVTLLNRPGVPAISASGCDGDDIDAQFDDEAGAPAEDACDLTPPAIAGFVTPFVPLANFDVDNINGDWILKVTDEKSGDTGLFEQWCLVAGISGNSAPVADSQTLSTPEDIAKSITLTASDLDGDSLTYSITVAPINGALSGAAPNVVYTPDLNYHGSDSFSFKANDGSLDSDPATIDITIDSIDDNPVAIGQNVVTNEDTAVPVVLTGSDAESSPLTFTLESSPSNGSLSGSAPNLIYTPSGNYHGPDSFTFSVNDGILDSAHATISITVNSVNDLPTANAQSLFTNEDTPLPLTLTGNDDDGDTLSFAITAQPSNGTLTGAAPNLTYVPDEHYNGPDSFDFRVYDGTVNSPSVTVTITVQSVNDRPVADSQVLATDEDTPLPVTLTGSDDDGDSLSFSIVVPPAHGSLSGAAPNLTYTPDAHYNGPDNFTFKVNDGTEDSLTASIDITINPINDQPVAVAQAVSTDEDTALPIVLNGTDDDGDSLTYTVVVPPAHGTLTGTLPNLSYAPTAQYNGPDSFTFKVNDGTVDSLIATIDITVNSVNDRPVANAQTLITDEDTPLPVMLSASDEDGDSLSFTIVTQPANGTLSGVAPNLSYNPNAHFNGSDSFTFKVNDGIEDSLIAQIDITINSVNDKPVANAASLSTDEDIPLPITLTGSDADGDPLTYSIVSLPSNGVLNGTAPNVSYVPNANYHGADSFTFRVNDGSINSNNATVSLTVNSINDRPVADDQSLFAVEDTALPITLSGSDEDGDSLNFTVVTPPANGTLSGTAPNLSYTPDAHFNGDDSFTFKVNDGTQDSLLATIDIEVSPVNDLPVANPQALSTNEDVPKSIVLTGQDDDGDVLTFTVLTQPPNGSLSGVAPSLTYTPKANFSGADSFTFKVNDGTVDSASAVISITIDAVNDPPVANGETMTALKGMSTTTLDGGGSSLLTNDTDTEGHNLSVSTTPLVAPSHGTISLSSNGSFDYLHDNTLNATDQFVYEVCDDGVPSECDSATVSIYVDLSIDDFCRAPLLAIPDGDPITGVSDTIVLSELGGLTDVNVYMLVTHTLVGHLTAILEHDGITVQLLNEPGSPGQGPEGCESDDIEAVFDDEGFALAEGMCNEFSPAIRNMVIPFGSLADFDGASVNGSWELTLTDTTNGESGLLEQWCMVPSIAGNTAPVANPQSVTTPEDTPKSITLTATDLDGDGLTYQIATPPAHGTLTGAPPNVLYTPDENYNGPDSFTFRANDGSLDSAAATVDITVSSFNDPPVANAQILNTAEDTPLPITLTGSDPEGSPLTFIVVSNPTNGLLSGSVPDLIYTPDLNFNGSDSFTFKVNDGSQDSDAAVISIAVDSSNDRPVADPQSVNATEDIALPIQLTASDDDGDSLSWAVVNPPSDGDLTGVPPSVTYTPHENYNGADSFTFKVNDGLEDSLPATVDIAIAAVNDPPQAGSDSISMMKGDTATILDGGSASLLTNDSDIEGDALTLNTVPVSGPAFGSLTLFANGSFSYTHDDTFHASDQFIYEACDDGTPVECTNGVVNISIDLGEIPDLIFSNSFEEFP